MYPPCIGREWSFNIMCSNKSGQGKKPYTITNQYRKTYTFKTPKGPMKIFGAAELRHFPLVLFQFSVSVLWRKTSEQFILIARKWWIDKIHNFTINESLHWKNYPKKLHAVMVVQFVAAERKIMQLADTLAKTSHSTGTKTKLRFIW